MIARVYGSRHRLPSSGLQVTFSLLTLFLLLSLLMPTGGVLQAAELASPSAAAESIRSTLATAQLGVERDPQGTRQIVAEAQASYETSLSPTLGRYAAERDARAKAGFVSLLTASDAPHFADARAQVWTAILGGAYQTVEQTLQAGDAATAQTWLAVREFRHATRFSRPEADATVAVADLVAGKGTAADTLATVRADLLDTYQARLDGALHDLESAAGQGFVARQAESAALAEGYFAILSPTYGRSRGPGALSEAQRTFADLRMAALAGQGVETPLAAARNGLQGFRAAPLSPADQVRRAGQALRYLALVPTEYGRGVKDGQVTRDLEIREAITFRNGAAAAFTDLQPALLARDSASAAEAARLFTTLEGQLNDAGNGTAVATPVVVQQTTDQLIALLRGIMPAEWLRRDSSGDFDVIATLLDQMETAVAAGQYDLAESARLEAYAVMETGPEARLIVFAPQLQTPIEDLFWYGQGDYQGLASLIDKRASVARVKASRAALDSRLNEAQAAIGGASAPLAVATNAGVIVFREGLEAVLILASLLGSLKMGTNRRFRRPLWIGAVLAFAFSVGTWFLAQSLLTALARFGEKLEAVVSIIAIGVLLTITNWFFHKVYWTGWMANFHQQKGKLIRRETGQWLGLMALGFTSIYREGFETVLFLQALVLDSNVATVVAGIAVGLAATFLVGLVVFALQAKLPYKKMLIATGVMICAVLVVMVGNTTHVLQVVGWFPAHPIAGVSLPYWTGLWFGVFATWEGLLLQSLAAIFVVGSYLLAERMKDRKARPARVAATPRNLESSNPAD